jgi:putative colanic acid biosynthesis glycosyltransferase
MKVLQINSVGTLSTGRIAADLCRTLAEQGYEGCVAFGRGDISPDINHIRIGSKFDVILHAFATRITDKTGFYSTRATKKFLKQIDRYKPDIIHLHNLHGYYINIQLLFEYLRKSNLPVIWTLHDCWAFTGHCAHFTMAGCDEWKRGCIRCPAGNTYPSSLFIHRSIWNYSKKRDLFTGMPRMTIVTPSNWLKHIVEQSFLNEYPIITIPNGIDLDVFKPTKNDFRSQNHLAGKFIILGVASTWSVSKGIADFTRLSTMLDDSFQIVLVGLKQKELARLPENIIGMNRVSIRDLAEIYTAADVFLNLSREETMGLTTVEALACGTPAIVYHSTALPETLGSGCGIAVKPGDLDTIIKSLHSMRLNPLNRSNCLSRAKEYERKRMYQNYINLYLQNDAIGCPEI